MEKRKLEALTPYDKNPRKNDGAVDKVLESLMRHGQVKPIVISEKGKPFKEEVVCAGHTTLRALERFGAKEAFVVVKAFADEAQFVDYNIRDNKVAEFAQWDEEMLAELGTEFEIDLKEMEFDLIEDSTEDFSDKNEEIDMDDLDDTCELKLKFDAEIYEEILDKLREYDDDLNKALLKVLNIEL